jgi:putative hydrolase of the HAD superfamily
VKPPLKAVFFDAGHTLFRPWPSVGHVYAKTARKHGSAVSPAWVEDRFQKVWHAKNHGASSVNMTDPVERLWWEDLVKKVFGPRVPRRKFRAFFDELHDIFARPECWRLFPETLPTLDALRMAGFTLGVVSNWDSRLFRLCRDLGVSRRVEFVLASAVVGYSKPHGNIFERALRLAGADPREALHVGDSLRDDYWGARKAGIGALLLSRHRPGPEGTEWISSLAEVAARYAGGPKKKNRSKLSRKN